MKDVTNIGETTLLNGRPLSLITRAGVERWIDGGIKHSYRYDRVSDPLSGEKKYRCLYELEGENTPFVLVFDPDSKHGPRPILFDSEPAEKSLI